MALDDAGDTSLLLGSEDVPPVREDNAVGPLAVSADLRPLRPADSARARRSRAARERTDAAHRLGHRHCRRRRDAVEASRRASDRAALFAAGDRLQPAAACRELDPAASAKPPTIPGNEGLAREAAEARRARDFRSLSSPHRRDHRSAPARRACRRCWCRCTASRRSMPASRGPGISARSIIATPGCRRCCCKLLRAEADLVVGDNEPYAVSDETDYTIPVHGEARGLMNTGIEIRQDLIADQAGEQPMGGPAGADFWRDRGDAAGAAADLDDQKRSRQPRRPRNSIVSALQHRKDPAVNFIALQRLR